MFYPVTGHFNLPQHFLKITAVLLCLALPGAALAQTVNLTVNATQTVRTVDERVFGVNSVIWDGQASTAQTISMVQAAGIRTIRVPGGSLSDDYHWRVNTSDANTWNWPTSFNGFINLITSANTQAVVTVNYGSGTPEEAAGLVAYLNASVGSNVTIGGTDNSLAHFAMQNSGYWASMRAASPLGSDDGMNFLRIGRTAPVGVKYFEIGNECYGTWETDQQTVAHDPTTYANRAKLYIAAMKAVDPTIKIGVVVVTSSENAVHNVTNPRTNTSHHGWTPTMLARLKTLGVTPDFVIYHLYPQAPGDNRNPNSGCRQLLQNSSKTWPNDAANLRQMLSDYLGTAGSGSGNCRHGKQLGVFQSRQANDQPGRRTLSRGQPRQYSADGDQFARLVGSAQRPGQYREQRCLALRMASVWRLWRAFDAFHFDRGDHLL